MYAIYGPRVHPHEQAVVDLVRKEFGEPSSLRFVEAWGPRVVAEVEVSESGIFVKAAGDADVRAEETVLALAGSSGVPVPELLASGSHPSLPGGRWIATRRAPGEPWQLDDKNGSLALPSTAGRTVQDIAASFGRLHRVRLAGFGPVSSEGAGSHLGWSDWLRDHAEECLGVLDRAGHLDNDFRRRAVSAFARLAPSISRGSLIHGDLGNSETFVDPESGALTCMVDWGGSLVGDPIYEFARFNAGGPADDPRPVALLPYLIEHYIAETGTDRQRFGQVLPLYRAHNAIMNAAWSYREGVPWIPGLLAKADVLLQQIGG